MLNSNFINTLAVVIMLLCMGVNVNADVSLISIEGYISGVFKDR